MYYALSSQHLTYHAMKRVLPSATRGTAARDFASYHHDVTRSTRDAPGSLRRLSVELQAQLMGRQRSVNVPRASLPVHPAIRDLDSIGTHAVLCCFLSYAHSQDLQDVASYLIARTLGVIDDTKASTSETGGVPSEVDTPIIVVQPESPPPTQTTMTTPPPTYFRGPMEEDGNLELSGVGMFSPAPSQPPSPTLSRRELSSHMHNISEERMDEVTSAPASERPTSRASSSGDSSYAMLEQESGAEDAPVTLRRRTQPGSDAYREDS